MGEDGYGDEVMLDLDPLFHETDDGVVGKSGATKFAVAKKTITDADIRCNGQRPVRGEPGEFSTCRKYLAKLAGRPWIIECPRCKTVNRSKVDPEQPRQSTTS